MFKRFQALKQAYKTITSTQPKTTKGLPQAIKTITSTKPKTTKEGKKKIELLKKLGKDQKKIGIDKYKDMGGNKLANEVLNVDKKAKGGRIGFKEGTGKSGVKDKDYKLGFKFQGDYKGKNLSGKAKEFFKTGAKQTVGTLKKGIKQNVEAFKKVKEKLSDKRKNFRKGTGKSGVPAMDIKSTPTKKLSEKQKKIARLAGDPRKIDKPDFAKLRNKNKKVI